MDDWLGGKRTIQISLLGFIAAALTALLTGRRALFWAAGLLIGLCGGPNQAASRSLMGRFVPEEKKNEFYGPLRVLGQGNGLYGAVPAGGADALLFASQRAGMAVVLVFFVIGPRADRARGRGAGEAAGGGAGAPLLSMANAALTRLSTLSLEKMLVMWALTVRFADEGAGGDLVVAVSLGQEAEDLHLPPGEALQPVGVFSGGFGMGLGGDGGEVGGARKLLVDPYPRRRRPYELPGTTFPALRPSACSRVPPALAALRTRSLSSEAESMIVLLSG